MLVLTKGLPLAYNRDLQLDKPPLFSSFELIKDITSLSVKLFQTLKVKKEVLAKRTQDEYFFTVDVMEYLIKKGMSYRDAHDTVGTMVKECLDKGAWLKNLSKNELLKYSKYLGEDVKKLFNPQMSVKMKKSLGSTNPQMVAQQIKKWIKILKHA